MSQSPESLFILNSTSSHLQSGVEWLQLLNELEKSKDNSPAFVCRAVDPLGWEKKGIFFHLTEKPQEAEAQCSTATGDNKKCSRVHSWPFIQHNKHPWNANGQKLSGFWTHSMQAFCKSLSVTRRGGCFLGDKLSLAAPFHVFPIKNFLIYKCQKVTGNPFCW